MRYDSANFNAAIAAFARPSRGGGAFDWRQIIAATLRRMSIAASHRAAHPSPTPGAVDFRLRDVPS
jgi:hypothetical protein